MMETSTRSARNRRVVAILGWMVLVGTAIILWNERIQGTLRTIDDELTACFLAAFAAFVGVFAWLLFNPGRRAASESPVLFSAAAATLFPPPIIGFCLMPIESPTHAWMVAFSVFFLCVIAVLSHVPEDFFGVPRGRSSYMTPIPTFDTVDDAIMSPDAAWFTFEDLTRILPDTERPSLSPRSYLNQDSGRLPVPSVRGQDKVASEVDDILGSDFDLGLLDEDFTDYDRPSPQQRSSSRSKLHQSETAEDQRHRSHSPGSFGADQGNRSTRERRETGRQTGRQTSSDSQDAAHRSVFESFDRASRGRQTEQSARYVVASAGQKNSSARKRRFRSASAVTSGTASSVRSQLKFENRQAASGQTGTGLSSTSRKAYRQPSGFVPPVVPLPSRTGDDSSRSQRSHESSDSNVDYGTLDVHRRRQPNREDQKDSRGESTGTSRRQDRLDQDRLDQERRERERVEQERLKKERLEQQRQDQERHERERHERERRDQERRDQERRDQERLERERRERQQRDQRDAARLKSTSHSTTGDDSDDDSYDRPNRSDRNRSEDQSSTSSRNQRLSRYEQRQQAAAESQNTQSRNTQSQNTQSQTTKSSATESKQSTESKSSDRHLTRHSTGRTSSDEGSTAATPKRRSALDIATAGLLGAGLGATAASAETEPVAETSDLDSAASQGLFGSVRDLFYKTKKSDADDSTGAEDFEADVESVQQEKESRHNVSIERTTDPSGAEMVEGVAVVRFERGQKKANVHIPFAPPMKGTPEVEVECVGDEQLRLKVPMAQPYGMRIEARRSKTSEALEAEIGFAALAEEE